MGDAEGIPRSLFAGGLQLKGQRKPAVKVNADVEAEQRELITGVEGSRIQSAAPVEEQPLGKKVLPKLENTFKIGGKFAPSFVPDSGADAVIGKGEDRFELAVPEQQEQQQDVQYGLLRREGVALPAHQPRDLRMVELEKFKRDMEELPDASLEQYENVGVEEFGMALLRGMGWTEGEGVGRNKKLVDAKEYIRRPDRLGLGAKPAPVKEDKRPVKMGDKPQPQRGELVLAPDADGRVRHMKTLDEKLVHRSQVTPGPHPNKIMRIIDGRHKGLLCKVLELLPREEGRSERAKVRLHPSDEDVVVRCKELGERHERGKGSGSEQEEPGTGAAATAAADKGREASSSGRASYGPDQRQDQKRKRAGSPDREPPGRSQKPPFGPSWLFPAIRVRIVDKLVRKGKLYLKKAVVVDVHPGHTCELRVEETQEVLQLHQDALETVVPKQPGAAVMVVSGKLRGHKAELLQVNSSKEAAAVKLVSDLSVQRLHLDDIAQYMGQLEEDY